MDQMKIPELDAQGIKYSTSWNQKGKVDEVFLPFDDHEWVELVEASEDGDLVPCCADISRARDFLSDALLGHDFTESDEGPCGKLIRLWKAVKPFAEIQRLATSDPEDPEDVLWVVTRHGREVAISRLLGKSDDHICCKAMRLRELAHLRIAVRTLHEKLAEFSEGPYEG